MQTTDTIPFPASDLVKNSWNFLEVWVDPMQAPPYILVLLGDKAGSCYIFDPAKQYRLIASCDTYEQAQFWLLEDEYEPLEGRLLETEIQDVGS